MALNFRVSIDEIFEDILKAHIGAREKSEESHEEDEKVLDHSGPGAVGALSDGVYDGRRHQSQSWTENREKWLEAVGGTGGSPGDGTHQGDEQVQLGDGRGQGEGEEDQTDPEDVLRLQVVVRLDPEY